MPARQRAPRRVPRPQSRGGDVAREAVPRRVGSPRAARAREGAARARARGARMAHARRDAAAPASRCPEPLALGTRADGDRLLALRVDRRRAARRTRCATRPPRAATLLAALAALVRRVHEAGFVHGDLHAGNVLVGARGPVLLDWQHARPARAPAPRAARPRAPRVLAGAARVARSPAARAAQRCSACPRRETTAARDALRAAGDAADARAREHARSRTASACRARSPRRSRSTRSGARGLRLRELGAEALDRDPRRASRRARSARCARAEARRALLGDGARRRGTARSS